MLVKLKRSFFGPDGHFYEVVNGAPVTIDEEFREVLPGDAEVLDDPKPLDPPLDPLAEKK